MTAVSSVATERDPIFEQWNADCYLADYYSCIEAEEEHTLQFLVRQLRSLRVGSRVLEFGIGPTLHHLLPVIPYAGEIHVADLLPANLEAIRRWQVQEAGAHNWNRFTHRVLQMEGIIKPTVLQMQRREALTRRLITQRLLGDARCAEPLGSAHHRQYDCVLSCYCADSAVSCKLQWRHYLRNIASLLKPGGLFIIAALRNCRAYKVGNQFFPAAAIDENDILECFASLGVGNDIAVEVQQVPEQQHLGFNSVVLAAATFPLAHLGANSRQ